MTKIKKITSAFLAVILTLGVLTVAPLTVSAATYGDFEYTLEEDYTCTITKYKGNASNVTIPSTIYGNKVGAIDENVFKDNQNLQNISLPNSLKSIGSAAFAGCSNLSKVTLPNSLKYLGYYAFNKAGIKSITLPFGLEGIPNRAFSDCKNLSSVVISNSVKYIDDYAFESCVNLQSVNIPNSVESLGSSAFGLCTNLKTVSIGLGLEGVYAADFHDVFCECPFLESIDINKNNENYCSYDGVVYDKNMTKILYYPQGKRNTSYTVPNTVRTIYKLTQNGNKYLKTVTILDNVTEIRDRGFGYIDFWVPNGISGFTIKGYKGTAAERYARNNDFKFIELPKPVAPTSVKLNTTKLSLGAGESYTLKKTISPSNATQSVTWSSSNKSVATVSNGKVTAKKSGTANITVKTSNGKTATCKVTVKPAPTSVRTNPTSVTLGKGETYTISESTNSGSYANAANLKWVTSNSSVATVTKGSGNKAKITAKGTGTAYIKISLYNGKTAQCKVTVKPAPTSVKTNPTSLTLGKGETYTISESTNSGAYANAANLKWSTSNSSVATVTKGSGNKAKITAKGTGTAYIKISLYNGKTAQCKVTVKSAPTSVKTNPTSLTLGKGETYTISESTNSGAYANAANLKWSTSNSSVATVTKGSGNKAKITAKGTGTAYIKIKLYNGKTAQCKVTVKPAPTSVKLSKTSITLKKGQTYTISESTNKGAYANAANLKWSSSNSSVATVTKGSANKAVIKAKSKGTAYIKIKLYNGKTAQCKVTVK